MTDEREMRRVAMEFAYDTLSMVTPDDVQGWEEIYLFTGHVDEHLINEIMNMLPKIIVTEFPDEDEILSEIEKIVISFVYDLFGSIRLPWVLEKCNERGLSEEFASGVHKEIVKLNCYLA